VSLPADDRPLTLKEAAERFGFTVSTLRAEAGRGRLDIFRIGHRDYTLASDVMEMIRRCREEDHRRASTSIRSVSNGQSVTDRVSSALVAAKETAQRLRKH
jgi:hypothetical protein